MKTDQDRRDTVANAVMAAVCVIYVAAVIFAVWLVG